ncbi:hypothetical protein chiPu_0008480 [Chiloscyllium punctatum]|uniref:EF-hand domain-containing protein n=1 Tax=Chiloscyllium punctatum TaxID=137246 RepID=A0A401SHZ1_CHIPU|nr:hypothetical protein [Chiloscyllium punctatum]
MMNRADSVVQEEVNRRQVRKGRSKCSSSASNKVKNKKRRTNTSVTNTNTTLPCWEAQQKVEEEMDKEIQANPFKRRICRIFSTSKLNNGSISFEDFLDMFSAFSEAAPADVKAEYAFRILDFNDNGTIDRSDLIKFLTLITGNEVHKILNETEMGIIIDMIMEDIDMDGDERINLSEFHHIASKMPDFAR